MKRRKDVMIDLVRPSRRSDLTCRDGEVADFCNVEWLEPDSGSPDSGNPDASAPSKGDVSKICEVGLIPENGVALPPGCRLLTLHRPDTSAGVRHIIAMQANGALCWRRMDGTGSCRNIAIWPSRLGRLAGAWPWRGMVVLAGSEGLGWLVYDAVADDYRWLDSLPEAPAVSITAEAGILDGYVRMAGNMPDISVDVSLDGLEVTADGVAAWLSAGDSNSVEESVRERIYEAVGGEIDLYMSAARCAGMWLAPCRMGAAFGTALPAQPQDCGIDYEPPYARVASWALRGSTLALGLEFSLRPVSLRVSYSYSIMQRAWTSVFPHLTFYLTPEQEWRTASDSRGNPVTRVISLTRLPAGTSGTAFRFASCSRAAMAARLASVTAMRKSLDVVTQGVTGGIATLRHPDAAAGEWHPDFTDFLPVRAVGGALTDEGVLLYDGGTLLTPMKENGVVYRHRDRIADAPVLAATQATLRKGVAVESRHALYVFCADGIRQATSGGDGGYHNARLISRFVLASCVGASRHTGAPLTAESESGIWFVADGRLCFLSLSGTVTSYGIDSVAADVEKGGIAVSRMLYDGRSASLLIATPQGRWIAFDTAGRTWHEVAGAPVSVGAEIMSDCGVLYTTGDAAASLCRLSVAWRQDDNGIDSEGYSETSVVGQSAGLSMMQTRPLKLGNPFGKKRICRVAVTAAAHVRVEGSDDMTEWICVAEGYSPLRGLHPEGFRFHRVTLMADEEAIDMLHILSVSYRI